MSSSSLLVFTSFHHVTGFSNCISCWPTFVQHWLTDEMQRVVSAILRKTLHDKNSTTSPTPGCRVRQRGMIPSSTFGPFQSGVDMPLDARPPGTILDLLHDKEVYRMMCQILDIDAFFIGHPSNSCCNLSAPSCQSYVFHGSRLVARPRNAADPHCSNRSDPVAE